MAIFDRLLHNFDMDFRINSVFYTKCSADWHWDISSLPDFDFWFVSSGSGKLLIGNREIKLGKATALVIPPGEKIKAVQDKEDPLSVYAVHFFPETNNSLLTGTAVEIEQPLFMIELFHRLISEYEKTDNSIWFNAVISEFKRNSEIFNKYGTPYAGIIREIISRIKNNPEQKWNVSSLAENASLSTDHFIRVFKKEYGKTPGAFILEQKIYKAQNLLIESNLSIQRIAELCGFESVSGFSRVFFKHRQITPGKYRRKYS